MLDSYDIRILDALQQQGDLGPVQMGALVHLSPSQCSRRMAALRRDGYVRAVRAILAPDRVGIGIQAYVMLTMKSHDPDASAAFRARLMALDEVMEAHALTGAPDMILKVATRDLDSFNRLLTRHVLAAPEVATARSSIILNEVKSTTSLPLRADPG